MVIKNEYLLLISLICLFFISETSFAQIRPVQVKKRTEKADREKLKRLSVNEPNVATDERSVKVRRVAGRVVGVHDGDTITVLDENKVQYKVRFSGIDAPELKQDFGQKSKRNLSDLVFGKTVIILYDKIDKYRRYVCTVLVDNRDANLVQVESGLAWHYKKYAGEQSEADRKTYAVAETKARAAKIGLWQQDNAVPPWDWRAESRSQPRAARVADVQSPTEKPPRIYQTGSRGGCFYLSSSGNKVYVRRSL